MAISGDQPKTLSSIIRHLACMAPGYRATPEGGLTLIECLVAIVVVAVAGAIIAPAMVISVATRVQSQKAEQALELAQSEIDNIRVLVERGEDYANSLPPSTTVTGGNEKELATVAGPSSLNSTPTSHTQARPIDIDGDGSDDFAIQAFRTPGQVVNSTPVAFVMGVRVYDVDAVANAGSSLPTDEASLGMVSGEGERGQRPLATLYTAIAASEDGQSLCNFIEYLSTAASTPEGCN